MRPVLVDSSVWRRFLSGASAARPLRELLDEDGLVVTHPWVIAELILGGLSTREEALLRRLPSAPQVAEAEVLALIRHRRLMRRGIGWVDTNLLASALVGSTALWTLDRALATVADALKLTPAFR